MATDSEPTVYAYSLYQVAPFNGYYKIDNSSIDVFDETISSMNSYWGGQYQQAASFLTDVDNDYYRDNSDEFGIFGVESYANENTRGNNYITWVANGKPSWTLPSEAIGPDAGADIGQRLISEEPMYMIMNFGELFEVIRIRMALTSALLHRTSPFKVFQTTSNR